eukprot:gb/GECH01001343.1/.p1 GENE.gb/GECH01001343.1/~~gb/GECH01001343.1/.p1  ORF type:complete len:511 (+),score=121.63 gb/GECH01001343.1/:1-1533(+)
MSTGISTSSSAIHENNWEETVDKVVKLLCQYIKENEDMDTPVVKFLEPEKLQDTLQLQLPEKGGGLENIMKDVKQTLDYSVRTGHKRFFNQLFAGTDLAGVLGEWVTAVLNTSMYTYEVAPVLTLMELKLIEKMCSMIGFENGDGVFCPGGSISNLVALISARNWTLKHVKKSGLQPDDKLVAFASAECHYSIKRGTSIIGLGMDATIPVSTDPITGSMDPEKLEQSIEAAIAQGKKPFFINATAGTTVRGSFDLLEEISRIAKKYNIWMHVDGAWGASVIFSSQLKHLVKGIHLADSVTWNPHKLMGVPLQCSAVLVNTASDPHVLEKCNASHADYLFHDHEDKNYDLGDKTIQCGRHVDVLKLWLSWKCHGDEGYARRVDIAWENTQHLVQGIKKRSDRFRLVCEPEFCNICFYYIPESLRDKIIDKNAETVLSSDPKFMESDEMKQLGQVTQAIKRKMQHAGTMLVNFQPLGKDLPNFFRMILNCPQVNSDDMEFVLEEIDRLGHNL